MTLPFGLDLDDEITVKLWSDGSITCIKYGGIGEQDKVHISKDGVKKLIEWINKHYQTSVYNDPITKSWSGEEEDKAWEYLK